MPNGLPGIAGLGALSGLLLRVVGGIALRPRTLLIGANMTLTEGPSPGEATLAAAGSATIAASAITSGTIATARLGSGSATSSTFLRGDQTYAVPAGGGSAFCGALVYNSANQSLTSGVSNVALTFDTPRYDTDTLWVIGAPTRLTVPAGKTGTWRIGGVVWFAGNAAGERYAEIHVNGSFIQEVFELAANGTNQLGTTFSFPWPLTAGDYVEVFPFQDSGGALDAIGATGATFFEMSFLGA